MAVPSTRQKNSVYLLGIKELKLLTGKNQLPTAREALLRFHFHLQQKKSVRNASRSTIEEINIVWQKALIPTRLTKHSIEKLEQVHSEWLLLKKNKGRTSETQKAKETSFVDQLDKLFDIAHAEALNLIALQQDKEFLIDQRTVRKMIITSEDKQYIKKQQRILQRKEKEEMRKAKSATASAMSASSSLDITDIDLQESLSSNNSSNNGDEIYQPTKKTRPLQKSENGRETTLQPKSKKHLFTQHVTGALDRNKVSDREAVRLIVPIAAALGYDPASMPLSRSTIKRKRQEARQSYSDELRTFFEGKPPIVVHWDGKILPDILGSEKVDRLPVLVSCANGEEKILGVPKLASGTGVNCGNAVHNALRKWNLHDKVIGMCFDTTSVNTGIKNGACTKIENEVGNELLWLACRHHVLEIILSKVFTLCLGPSSSPEVPLFKRLREAWKSTYRENYTVLNVSSEEEGLKNSTINSLVPMLEKKNQPRDDYMELIELTLLVLGHSLKTVHWRAPGPIHHARWMAKLIYALKLYLFQDQGVFHLTHKEKVNLHRFVKFGALLYVRNWIEASVPANSSINDLLFWKDAGKYSIFDEEISKTVRKALQFHLWYLSDELVGISLFSDKVSEQEKLSIVNKITAIPPIRMVRGNPDLLHDNCEISDFANSRTIQLLLKLEINSSFITLHPSKWNQSPEYINGKETVKNLKVVNDIAERGVKLFQDYNKLITNDEEEKQLLLQVVEANRKLIPTEMTKKAMVEIIRPSTSKD